MDFDLSGLSKTSGSTHVALTSTPNACVSELWLSRILGQGAHATVFSVSDYREVCARGLESGSTGRVVYLTSKLVLPRSHSSELGVVMKCASNATETDVVYREAILLMTYMRIDIVVGSYDLFPAHLCAARILKRGIFPHVHVICKTPSGGVGARAEPPVNIASWQKMGARIVSQNGAFVMSKHGPNLAQHMYRHPDGGAPQEKRACSFPLFQVQRIVRQLLVALVYAHEKVGVAHLDINPNNVFVFENAELSDVTYTCRPNEHGVDKILTTSNVVLGDWSNHEMRAGVSDQWRGGHVVATNERLQSKAVCVVMYRPPEVWPEMYNSDIQRTGAFATMMPLHRDVCAIDIWSLGVTAMELFLGMRPQIRTWSDMIRTMYEWAHWKESKMWSWLYGVCPSFAQWCHLAVTPDPHARPSARQLLLHEFMRAPLLDATLAWPLGVGWDPEACRVVQNTEKG